MEKSQQLRPIKENWVDAVKILACILVVLGHFFQSMVKSDIIPETHLYSWFNQTIYYFHVPLFFICSGYLFQKFTSIGNFGEWKDNFLKKFVSLAIPYFVFSLATYLMKTVFSDSVNKERGGLIDTLFLNPTSPYWYLYALIFIFLITITIKRNTDAVAFIVAALAMKVASFFVDSNIYALNTVLENEIWFVFGMLICYCNIPSVIEKIKSYWGLLTSVIFIAVSIIIYRYTEWNEAVAFAMGVFGCVSVLLVALTMRQQGGVSGILSKYTFPVFLMHTIFAAGLRTVLFKLEISNSVIHIILGLTISFIGPVIVAAILAKLKYTEFLIYPNKFVRIGMKKNEKKT